MKKVIIVMLIFCLTLSICACGTSNKALADQAAAEQAAAQLAEEQTQKVNKYILDYQWGMGRSNADRLTKSYEDTINNKDYILVNGIEVSHAPDTTISNTNGLCKISYKVCLMVFGDANEEFDQICDVVKSDFGEPSSTTSDDNNYIATWDIGDYAIQVRVNFGYGYMFYLDIINLSLGGDKY